MNNLEQRLSMIEFRQELLFNNNASDRIIYASNITPEQYKQVINILESYSDNINKGIPFTELNVESDIFEVTKMPYSFTRTLLKSFNDEERWQSVYQKCYGLA